MGENEEEITNNNPTAVVIGEPAAAAPEHELHEPPAPQQKQQQRPLDLSPTVSTRFTSVAPDAGLHTLFCLFHQTTVVNWVVSLAPRGGRNKREVNELAILSRSQFVEVLLPPTGLAYP